MKEDKHVFRKPGVFKNYRFKGINTEESWFSAKKLDTSKISGAFFQHLSEIVYNYEKIWEPYHFDFDISQEESQNFLRDFESSYMKQLFSKVTRHYAAQVCLFKERLPFHRFHKDWPGVPQKSTSFIPVRLLQKHWTGDCYLEALKTV